MSAANPLKDAYAGAGERWKTDAELAYGPWARHLVDRGPRSWSGMRMLDAGAGTGAAGAVLDGRGATVVAVDLDPSMLATGAARARAHVAGDVLTLPFRTSSFDGVVAAFVLNHLPDPAAGLREFARVTRPGGVVLASVFSADRSLAKIVIEETLRSYGWQPPRWYALIQQSAELTGTAPAMAATAEAAGLVDVDVTVDAVDVGLNPGQVVRYRWALPHNARFLAQLSDGKRRELFDASTRAVADLREPFRPEVIELKAGVS